MNRGRSKDAIEKARQAIAADPTDAIAYLYLGSALQDSGHWKDGIEAYSECVRHATKGSVNECRIMGGQQIARRGHFAPRRGRRVGRRAQRTDVRFRAPS